MPQTCKRRPGGGGAADLSSGWRGPHHNQIDPKALAAIERASALDRAWFEGARLVVGNEVEVGRTWAESKLKALTGGDRLQGRFMRQDFFEFDPQFKLMVIGNNKPSLRGVDEAIPDPADEAAPSGPWRAAGARFRTPSPRPREAGNP